MKQNRRQQDSVTIRIPNPLVPLVRKQLKEYREKIEQFKPKAAKEVEIESEGVVV